jgi:eukaryotic-like serine/threonine-protein kinase
VAGDGQGDRPSWASTTATADSWLRDAVEAPARTPASLEEIAPHLAVGDLIAERFRLEQQLGEGGMGVVWAARHVVTRKSVALKFVKHTNRADPETRQRFLREARAACAVRHPSVVEVHDVLELDDGSPVMVMDLLVGESMAQRLHREHKLPLPEVARIMVPVCAGVGSAHALGIVHRDLKPDNIFLCVEGDGSTGVKVLDFGIAKLTATEGDAAHTGASTNTGMLLGTPYYMAPEQMFAEKDIDHRADLWAIGVILYQALAGQRPTQGANVAQIIKVIARENIVPLRELAPSLPEPVLGLVGRLLALDRDERASDLREVVSVLSEYTSVHAEPFGAPRAAPSSSAPTPVAAQAPDATGSPLVAARRHRRAGDRRCGRYGHRDPQALLGGHSCAGRIRGERDGLADHVAEHGCGWRSVGLDECRRERRSGTTSNRRGVACPTCDARAPVRTARPFESDDGLVGATEPSTGPTRGSFTHACAPAVRGDAEDE